jgi:hypothetical protein
MDVNFFLPLIISIGLIENQKHHTVGTIPNSNIKIVEKLKLKFCWNLINSEGRKKFTSMSVIYLRNISMKKDVEFLKISAQWYDIL